MYNRRGIFHPFCQCLSMNLIFNIWLVTKNVIPFRAYVHEYDIFGAIQCHTIPIHTHTRYAKTEALTISFHSIRQGRPQRQMIVSSSGLIFFSSRMFLYFLRKELTSRMKSFSIPVVIDRSVIIVFQHDIVANETTQKSAAKRKK